jgi:signal transduction histidine kinase
MAGDGRELVLAARIAEITAKAVNLEQVARPFLELLEDLIGFESTYVTVLHWEDFKQEIRYARNSGSIEVTEGAFVEWSDTLCRRALMEGRMATDDVPSVWPDSDAAREVGIVSYVSVPIVTAAGSTFGTLCGATGRSVTIDDDDRRVMELFARLLADQVERERHVGRERERVAAAALHAHANAVAIASSEHKLKTPLTIIRGAAGQLVDDSTLTESERRSLVDALARQSAALEAQVHELLVHSQPMNPPPTLELETVHLEPVLVRVVSDLRLVDPGRPITLSCADRLACRGNVVALTHALEHLVDNAIKYTPGAVEVAALEADGLVAITVSDEGPGVTADDLFVAFQRGVSSDGIPGSGLGLYIVRALVEGMAGTVEAETSPSGGALMRIELPMATTDGTNA